MIPTLGIVAIGRNEGERLKHCLDSIQGKASAVVYVDSGSTDQSVAIAKASGAVVVELDMDRPFSAARARNEGFGRLVAINRQIEFVQFVDGDCEVVNDWLEKAHRFLSDHPETAIVCGRRRERCRDRTIYNRLCDIEWDTPIGETTECGGDAMMRVSAFDQVDGFNPNVIAGEEPELCVRLRQHSWKIRRLDEEMTLHDAAMTRLGQWWRRSLRAGHAHAQAASMHGTSRQTHWGRCFWSAAFWSIAIPVIGLGLAMPTHGWSLMLFIAYPLWALRIALKLRRPRLAGCDRCLYGVFCMLGKFAEMAGQIRFFLSRLSGKRSAIIEYKHVPTA